MQKHSDESYRINTPPLRSTRGREEKLFTLSVTITSEYFPYENLPIRSYVLVVAEMEHVQASSFI